MNAYRWSVPVVLATALACGGPLDMSGTPAPPDAGIVSGAPPPPEIVLLAPAPSQQIEFENEDDDHHGDDRFDVEVEVRNAQLAEPGRCPGGVPCGQLVLSIDGNACGTPNAASSARRFQGRFGQCRKPSGRHQLVVQLVDDRGNVLASTAPVVVEVRLKGGKGAGGEGGGADDHGQHDGGDDHGDEGGGHG